MREQYIEPSLKQRVAAGLIGASILGGIGWLYATNTPAPNLKGKVAETVIANPNQYEQGVHEAGVPLVTGLGVLTGLTLGVSLLEINNRLRAEVVEAK